jgi:methylenetetrahydrofolate reductase (NADPH)
MESRALQLARMGMKNILALTGDYSGTGFGGQGAPVFDLDSVTLLCMLTVLSERIREEGDPEGFFAGCAVSPFKKVEGECFGQYYKLCKKTSAGARFAITQLGYDARKFQELMQVRQHLGIRIPVLGSVYILTPRTAAVMNSGKVPGAVVTVPLLQMVQKEWKSPKRGRDLAIERAARLGVVLKGLGYRGVHIGGILKEFETVGRILDRMAQIEGRWKDFLMDFRLPEEGAFYLFKAPSETGLSSGTMNRPAARASARERVLFRLMRAVHHAFFRHDGPLSPGLAKIAKWLDKRPLGRAFMGLTEDPLKKLLLSCLKCGDCGIQHLAFLCPESQCPKHIRNGACGGSRHGRCEVYPDRPCVWVRAYNRLASARQSHELARGCVPPRMWELNQTSSWLNFHLRRDHQSVSCAIARTCGRELCVLHETVTGA